MDITMEDFPPWEVFRELFGSHKRVILMDKLIEKGFWTGADIIESRQGSFMGDGMSFIHLTLLLGGLTRGASQMSDLARPLGQSVGDDLFILKTQLKFCINFMRLARACNCEFSKINSISRDAATFCEQWMAMVSDLDTIKDLDAFKDSIFGDTAFIDCIKGSTLAGKSKVKSDKSDPFIGHATLLTKQVKWNPFTTIKERAPIFLWCRNYRQAVGIGIKFASLPTQLGGMEIAIGNSYEYNDDSFQEELLPYFERILELTQIEFLQYYLLLRGIFKANPKGFSYENNWAKIQLIVNDCNIVTQESVTKQIPDHILAKGYSAQRLFVANKLKLSSFHDLADTLARLDAFEKHWEMKDNKTFLSVTVKDCRRRANQALAIIKSNLTKKEKPFRSNSMLTLAAMYREKSEGLYVRKDDEAVIKAFGGMPDLVVNYEQLY
jgi:hypothetical protein